MKKWRLIPFLEGNGQLQMAIDQWLLTQHQQGKILPTLRFYTWHPVTISLGYHQKNYPPFWHNLTYENQSVNLVRRPTGGRAVLHQGDLTYMIVTADFQGKRVEVYQQLCQFLREGWQELGYELLLGENRRGYIHHASCFHTATGSDLIFKNGYKLIGSAQLKRGKSILQHGSMRLFPDVNLFAQVFPDDEKITPMFLDIQDQAQFKQNIMETLIKSAQKCFEMELITEPFSPQEWTEILALL